MKNISLKVPDELANKLVATAQKKGLPKSVLIRQALEHHFLGLKSVRKLSFFELGRDLCGAVRGPADLSTNPKYFGEFGK